MPDMQRTGHNKHFSLRPKCNTKKPRTYGLGSPPGSGQKRGLGLASTQYAIQKALEDPITFTVSYNPDILYWDQAMKAHDRDKFIEAIGIELDGHEKMGNYEPIPIRNVPEGTKLIDMVWSMHRKRCIKMQEVYKLKA